MKSKHTKKALLMSVLSMLMCMAMLVGSTFAWFTDSVTSGMNKIVAGNLDVELYHSNGKVTNEPVNAETNLFVGAGEEAVKWEPGVMVYENFTVKNIGSLALKYKLTLNAECNTVDGKSLKDVLKVAVLDEAFTGDRAAAQALTFDKTVADFERSGQLAADDAGKAGDTYAVVIYWEPSANDNDYNFNNERKDLEALYVNLGVNLVAAQATAESDSFGDDYDAKAEYPVTTSKELVEALEKAESGDKILLFKGSYEMPDEYAIAEGVALIGEPGTVLNVNGGKKDITVPDPETGITQGLLLEKDNITISGITITGDVRNAAGDKYTGYNALVRITGNNVTLENVTIDSKTNDSPIVIANTAGNDNNITIKNCTVTAAFKAIHIVDGTKGTVTIDGSKLDAIYPISVNTNSSLALSVSNSVLKGWTSYGPSVTKAVFDHCEFGIGHGYGYVVAYADTDFINCEFGEGFLAQTKNNYNKTMTFTNCFKAGTKITEANVLEQFHADNDRDSLDQAAGWSVIVDGNTVLPVA